MTRLIAMSGVFTACLLVALLLFPLSKANAAEPVEDRQKDMMDLFSSASSGVHKCCEGQAWGCARYEDAKAGIVEWCAKGEKDACEFSKVLRKFRMACEIY